MQTTTFKTLVKDVNLYKKGELKAQELLKKYPQASLKTLELASVWSLTKTSKKEQ